MDHGRCGGSDNIWPTAATVSDAPLAESPLLKGRQAIPQARCLGHAMFSHVRIHRGDVPMQERRTLVICLCAVFVVTLAYQLFRGLFLLTFVFVIIVGKDCSVSC